MNYSMAFLSYFKIFELINDYYIEFDDVSSQLKFKESGKALDYCRFESGTYKFTSQNKWNPFEAPTTVKLYNIFNYLLGLDVNVNKNFYQGIYRHNELRKKMIHPSDMANYVKAEKEDCRKIAKDISFIISKLS